MLIARTSQIEASSRFGKVLLKPQLF